MVNHHHVVSYSNYKRSGERVPTPLFFWRKEVRITKKKKKKVIKRDNIGGKTYHYT